MIQLLPNLPGRAQLLALEVGHGLDARRGLREHDVRELRVDRRDVADRHALGDGRDDRRPVGEPDVHGALADERDERVVLPFWNVTSRPAAL